MTIERQAASGLKWTAASKIVAQVAGWVVTLWVIRLLAPSDYGLLAMVAVAISVASTIAELGLGASVVQARSLPREQLSKVAGLVVLLNLGVGAAVFISAPLVAWAFDEPRLTALTRVMSLQFGISAVGAMPQALMARELKFKQIAWIELASGLTSSMATLALALMSAGVWSVALGGLAGGAMRSLLLVVFGENVRPDFRLRGVGAHLSYGGTITLTRIGWDLIWQSDIVVASRFLSTSAIGTYSVSLHLATLPMQKIMSVVNQIAFATVASLQSEPDRMKDGLLAAFRLATLVSVPLLWGLSSCAQEVVHILLGAKWEGAVFPLQVISLVIPLRLVSGIMVTAVQAVGRTKVYLQNMLVGAVVFPTTFLIGAQWGLEGLAIAWPVAWFVNFAATFPRVAAAIDLSLQRIVSAVRGPLIAGFPWCLPWWPRGWSRESSMNCCAYPCWSWWRRRFMGWP